MCDVLSMDDIHICFFFFFVNGTCVNSYIYFCCLHANTYLDTNCSQSSICNVLSLSLYAVSYTEFGKLLISRLFRF